MKNNRLLKTLLFYWSKFAKKIAGKSVKNSHIDSTAKIQSMSTFIDSTMGKKSFCGYYCSIHNCEIGSFCSILDYVTIGGGSHPTQWVSSSCAFYEGKDSVTKELASLKFDYSSQRTVIGHDVWIGHGVHIKDGISIGTGSIIGMGSVVTKNVAPYAIIGGVPAKVIRMRFDDKTIDQLLRTQWWLWDDDKLKEAASFFNCPNTFLRMYAEE